MKKPRDAYFRYKTYPSGKRVRLLMAPGGHILERTTVQSRARRTRTGRKLARIRSRIRRYRR